MAEGGGSGAARKSDKEFDVPELFGMYFDIYLLLGACDDPDS